MTLIVTVLLVWPGAKRVVPRRREIGARRGSAVGRGIVDRYRLGAGRVQGDGERRGQPQLPSVTDTSETERSSGSSSTMVPVPCPG